MDSGRRYLLIGAGIIGAVAASGLLPTACAMSDFRRKAMGPPKPPARPLGIAKPMLDEDIGPVLARLDTWYAAHLPPDRYVFNAPATNSQLSAFEQIVGLKMPPAYRQLYRWHDGENDDRFGHIYGLPLLPLKEAAEQWSAWAKILAQFGGDRYAVQGAGWPKGAVDPAYSNPRWIPLTHDGSGNHIGLDFDPWPGGRVGQVILFGRNEDVKVVLARSLGQFLEWIAGLLEGGNFRLTATSDAVVLRQFGLKQPQSNDFHEAARILVGAPGQFL